MLFLHFTHSIRNHQCVGDGDFEYDTPFTMKWILNCRIWIRKFNTWTYFVTPWNMLWMLKLDTLTHDEQWITEWEFIHFIFSSFSAPFFRAQIFSSSGQNEWKFSLQFLYSCRAMPWIWRVPNWSYTKFNIFIIKTIRCAVCSVHCVYYVQCSFENNSKSCLPRMCVFEFVLENPHQYRIQNTEHWKHCICSNEIDYQVASALTMIRYPLSHSFHKYIECRLWIVEWASI